MANVAIQKCDAEAYEQRAKKLTRVFGICGACGADLPWSAVDCESCEMIAKLTASLEQAQARALEAAALDPAHACSGCAGTGHVSEFGAMPLGVVVCTSCDGRGVR